MQITKQTLVRLVRDMPDDETRRRLVAALVAEGTFTEQDLATMVADEIEEGLERFAEIIREDRILQFYWERFRDHPQYLARALARLRPDLFYTYGLAFRLVLKLRADLGPVIIPPHRPRDERLGVETMAELPHEIRQDLFALDVECRSREMLYYFSRSIPEGFALLEEEIRRTTQPYERQVLEEVLGQVRALLQIEIPGTVTALDGRPFPALHVRWWINRVRNVPRCLNIGDTGTYKTAFATLAMHCNGQRRVLVLCAPHARTNWEREIARYFTSPPTIQVIERAAELVKLTEATFTIVGYATLAQPGSVDALIAHEFDGLIVDECQYAKGVTGSEQSHAARAIACGHLVRELPLKRYIALSATPWENHPDEFAAVAVALRPDLFPSADRFLESGASNSPRFLRELFAEHVLEVDLREIRDLPAITPKPWEDLFGVELIRLQPAHERIYRFVHDYGSDAGQGAEDGLKSAQKVQRLLQAAVHPHLVEPHFDWPAGLRQLFRDWRLSTKLVWLHEYIATRIDTGKIVVGTGLYAEGITRTTDDETAWVGRLLREWFGEDRVLILDGTVSARRNGRRQSPRDALIERWRTDPTVRVLLISTQACPDSVNLTTPAHPTVQRLWVTALSFGWKPWKQFLGRFWREGQGVPVDYRVPILMGTIDEDLFALNEEKWRIQQLFRAQVPLSEREWQLLRQSGSQQLREILRSSADHVARITSMMRGRGEDGSMRTYAARNRGRTNAELFAEHFLRIQDHAGSGHISRFVSNGIDVLAEEGIVSDERCCDAGCGPLTMARRRSTPWHSIDMNEHMVALGRQVAPHLAVNARVGFLSELPKEWTGKFDLTVASLVLHFSSLKQVRHDEPERLRILGELIRITHPHGLLWLNWNEGYQTRETFLAWADGFTRAGCTVLWSLSGLIRATDADPKRPFRFWSLVVSPNGRRPAFPAVDPFRFPFELPHQRVIKPRDHHRNDHAPGDSATRRVLQRFEVMDVRTRKATVDAEAARHAAEQEIHRWCAAAEGGQRVDRRLRRIPQSLASNWRFLESLRAHGLLDRVAT
ncbi:hypothetical protein HY634_02685 [Candidatus Uhrbacteria bacterium]|nr:hypothetical protein [Candidatus Uhrbacteria bacterium]